MFCTQSHRVHFGDVPVLPACRSFWGGPDNWLPGPQQSSNGPPNRWVGAFSGAIGRFLMCLGGVAKTDVAPPLNFLLLNDLHHKEISSTDNEHTEFSAQIDDSSFPTGSGGS
jgi:hypothetical protein